MTKATGSQACLVRNCISALGSYNGYFIHTIYAIIKGESWIFSISVIEIELSTFKLEHDIEKYLSVTSIFLNNDVAQSFNWRMCDNIYIGLKIMILPYILHIFSGMDGNNLESALGQVMAWCRQETSHYVM